MQVCCRALEIRVGLGLGLILIDLTLIHFIHLYHWLSWVAVVTAVLLILSAFLWRTPHVPATRGLKNKAVI